MEGEGLAQKLKEGGEREDNHVRLEILRLQNEERSLPHPEALLEMLREDFPQIPVRAILLPHREGYLNEILDCELLLLSHCSQLII